MLFFSLLVGCFIIVILELELLRERENNLAILREMFSLPSLGYDVMSENLLKKRQICYSKTFFSNVEAHYLRLTYILGHNLGCD